MQREPEGGWAKYSESLEDFRKRGFIVPSDVGDGHADLADFKRELVGISDEFDDDRAWGKEVDDKHPRKLMILAFQRGEQYIHAAAMKLDPESTVQIVYDTSSAAATFKKEGTSTLGAPSKDAAITMYKHLYGEREPKSDYYVQMDLASSYLRKALSIRQFLIDSNIRADRIKLVGVPGMRSLISAQLPSRATNIVTKHYRAGREAATAVVSEIVPQDAETNKKVETTFEKSGLVRTQKYALLWSRGTGATPGGAPGWDTRKSFADQLIATIKEQFGDRKVQLIGDPLFKHPEKHGLDGEQKLIRFWDIEGLDMKQQLRFLQYVQQQTDSIAIGMESGVLEMPALLGMRTIYLEPAEVANAKGNRWQTFWDPSEEGGSAIATLRRLQYQASTLTLGPMVMTYRQLKKWGRTAPDAGRPVPEAEGKRRNNVFRAIGALGDALDAASPDYEGVDKLLKRNMAGRVQLCEYEPVQMGLRALLHRTITTLHPLDVTGFTSKWEGLKENLKLLYRYGIPPGATAAKLLSSLKEQAHADMNLFSMTRRELRYFAMVMRRYDTGKDLPEEEATIATNFVYVQTSATPPVYILLHKNELADFKKIA